MPRVKRGTKRRQKRKKILERASGYFLTKSKLYRSAKESVERGLKFAYSGRKQRKRQFQQLRRRLKSSSDPVRMQMAAVMAAFMVGLFAGPEVAEDVQDNLELERWFRLPKGHERRIHGRKHAGVRLVQEGATLMPVLDAHGSVVGVITRRAAETLSSADTDQ